MPASVAGESGLFRYEAAKTVPASGSTARGVLAVRAVTQAARIIIVEDGLVERVHANSDTRSKERVVFIVREGGVDGQDSPLTAEVWNAALPQLRQTVTGL